MENARTSSESSLCNGDELAPHLSEVLGISSSAPCSAVRGRPREQADEGTFPALWLKSPRYTPAPERLKTVKSWNANAHLSMVLEVGI